MKLKTAFLFICASMLCAAPAAHAAATLTPGLYEYTMKMNMPGAPMNMPPQTLRRCLSPKDVGSNKALEMPPEPNSDCQVKDMVLTGGQYSYKVSCTRPQKLTGTVKGTLTATSMTMDMTMTIPEVPGPIQQSATARRIGECK